MIEVLKEALEALVSSTGELSLRLASPTDALLVKNVNASKSLRQAIADLEKQEPAIWGCKFNKGNRLDTFLSKIAAERYVEGSLRNGADVSLVPLYASPQPRKPLTFEQREEIGKRWRSRNWTLGDIIDSVEQAHGIKE
jgi:hypothetical protein